MLLKHDVPQHVMDSTAVSVDPKIDEQQCQVKCYYQWLAVEAKQNTDGRHQQECQKYAVEASKTITVKEQAFRTFAPFQQTLSAYKTLTNGQSIILTMILIGCALSLVFYTLKTVVVIIATITVFYLLALFLDFLLTFLALSRSKEDHIDDEIVYALADADWPRYTILCPLYREANVIPQFIQAMERIDYPTDRLQILFLTEENDRETRAAIEAMRPPPHFSIVIVPDGKPRTKPRACNFGLLQATGDYLVIYDAEDIPDPLQLKKAVLTFANHDSNLACVQAKLNYYNTRQNLLTRWFTVEYSLWFDLMLPGMQQTRLPLPLGGTSNHFRTELLRRVGAWDPFNVTEDCDLGLRLARSRLKTTVLNSTTYEEANSQIKNWMRQRSRWIKGYLQTYLVYMRQPLIYLRQGRLREFLALQLLIGGKAMVLFVNPILWILLAIYIGFHPIVVGVYHALFPTPVLYLGTICLIFGNFLYIYSHLIGCMKRGQYSLVKCALSIPIYWMMMSIAASRALYQLIFKPHYWEKTKHGLHLSTSRLLSGSTNVKEKSELVAPTLLPAPKNTKTEALELAEFAAMETTPLPALQSAERVSPLVPPSGSKLRQGTGTWRKVVIASMKKAPFLVLRSAKRPVWSRSKHAARQQWLKEPWLAAILLTACAASIAPVWKYCQSKAPSLVLRSAKRPVLRRSEHAARQQWFKDPWLIAILLMACGTNIAPVWKYCQSKAPSLVLRSAKRPVLRRSEHAARQQWFKDPWLIAILLMACGASIASCWYYFQNHEILLYEDAFSHLSIARRTLDSLTPGFAQLGGVWLPLPHVLMLPFIWNDDLWRTGLAGSFPSMVCYLVTTLYLYLAARRLTRNSPASFIGVLAFIFNPNILYLQSTPLSELTCIVTMTMTGYYFLAWVQDDRLNYLILAAGSTYLATLARYDGWILFPALLVFIVFIGWIRHQGRTQIEGNLIVFGAFGGLGIGLWLLWCGVIFGDPLYFQRGQYSAQSQTTIFLQTHVLETYHNLFQSFRYYALLCVDTMGPLPLLVAAVSLVVFIVRKRLKPETFAVFVFLTPLCFYVFSLYTGQANLYVPQVVPPGTEEKVFNVRFGAEMVAPVALLLALLSGQRVPKTFGRYSPLVGSYLLVGMIFLQTMLIAEGGVITLHDGQYGGSCAPTHQINAYLWQHYAGGLILENIFSSKIDGTEAGVDLKEIVSESSGALWKEALNNPSMSNWIITRPGLKIDPIVTHIDLNSPAFRSQFTLVVHEPDGINLYHRNGLPPLPTRPLPSGFLTMHSLCNKNRSG